MKRALILAVVVLSVVSGGHRVWGQARPTGGNPAAVFSDPQRRAKLTAALPEIDRVMSEFVKRSRVPGAAWGIVIDGEMAHVGVAGIRETSSQTPVNRDTVFRIASMTKSFTAMAVLKLRDEGKLSLE